MLLSLAIAALPSSLSYINNFPDTDNAFGVKIPQTNVRNNSFAFLIADYGLPPPGTVAGWSDSRWTNATGTCCQTDVADLMRTKRIELEAAGKSLLFVGAGEIAALEARTHTHTRAHTYDNDHTITRIHIHTRTHTYTHRTHHVRW